MACDGIFRTASGCFDLNLKFDTCDLFMDLPHFGPAMHGLEGWIVR
jgi:hypothetical protein